MSVLPPLDRSLLGEVFKDPRLISTFEQLYEMLEEAAATAASVSGSSGAIQSAPVLLTSESEAFTDARVIAGGTGIDVADAGGLLTVSVDDVVPQVDGGHPVRFIVTDDTTLLLPKTGRLATIAEVEAMGVTSPATGWGNPIGTATRTAFDTASVTLPQLAERVKGLIDDLKALGILDD